MKWRTPAEGIAAGRASLQALHRWASWRFVSPRGSLRAQLLFSHFLLVLLMLVTMGGAVMGFFRLGHSIDKILVDNYKSVIAAQEMKETLERQDSSVTFFLAGQVDKGRDQYQANWPRFLVAYDVEAHNITEPGEQALAEDIGVQFASYRKAVEKLLYADPPMSTEMARATYFGTLEPAFLRLKQRAQDVLEVNQAAILRADERARAEAGTYSWVGILVTAGSSFLALLFAVRMTGAALAPLRTLSRQAEEIGRGNLEQRIALERSDELGVLARSFDRMAQNLQEARRLEMQRLQRAERMSAAALESLYDPVVVSDAAGLVLHVNRAAEALFGSPGEVVGRPLEGSPWGTRILESVRLAIGQENPGAEARDGLMSVDLAAQSHTFRLRASPMRDEAGTLLGAVTVLEDITHLRELDRLKTEFIGVASHELRTPVTSLLLSVELLLEGALGRLTPEQTEIVEAQREDLARLQAMMRDLLDMTRFEAGASAPCRTPVALLELVEAAVGSVRHEAENRGVDLTFGVPAGLPSVRVDRLQITRVLVNLIGNAVRHTPSGGTVACAVGCDGKEVQVSVRDTGVGIPRPYLPRIFERFVQVPGATRGGAGLGLSIAQQIIRDHGGRIWVESAVGQGSTFSFTLPLPDPEPSSEKESETWPGSS